MSEPSREEPARTPGLPWPALLPWHAATLAALTRARDALPHALLVHGPAGIGKHGFALHVAKALLCEAPPDPGGACEGCAGCRYVLAGQHPDLMRVEQVTLDEDTGEPVMTDTIGVDRIRAMIDFTQLTSHRHRAKVAVIAPAERMNAAAANALLKTLEEPPAGTYLILVSHQAGRLAPTILSRCRRVPLHAPTPDEGARWLREQGIAEPEAVLAQAGGAPMAALALGSAAVQRERAAWLESLARPDALGVVELAARVEGGGREARKERLGLAIDWLLAWTSDLARALAGSAPARNPDYADALLTLAPRVARVALFRYHRIVLEQRTLLGHPLQPRLVAEALLADYRSLFDAPGARQ